MDEEVHIGVIDAQMIGNAAAVAVFKELRKVNGTHESAANAARDAVLNLLENWEVLPKA